MSQQVEQIDAQREAAATAGAGAEAAGLPLSWNPHRQPGPLRSAWGEGWQLSRADRTRHGPTGDAP